MEPKIGWIVSTGTGFEPEFPNNRSRIPIGYAQTSKHMFSRITTMFTGRLPAAWLPRTTYNSRSRATTGYAMHPDAAKMFCDMFDRMEDDGAPIKCSPRLFWYGHKLRHIVKCKDGVWTADSGREYHFCDRVGAWTCKECGHDFESEDGTTCPECGAVSKA